MQTDTQHKKLLVALPGDYVLPNEYYIVPLRDGMRSSLFV